MHDRVRRPKRISQFRPSVRELAPQLDGNLLLSAPAGNSVSSARGFSMADRTETDSDMRTIETSAAWKLEISASVVDGQERLTARLGQQTIQ
jgi:hypothetical protein